MSPEEENKGLNGVEVAQAAPSDRAGEAIRSSQFERKEMLCDMDVNWDDEYLLKFASYYPVVMKQHMEEVQKVACMDKSAPEYIVAKADLFGKILGTMQWRIRAEHLNQGAFVAALRSFSGTPEERQVISDQLIDSRYKVEYFEMFKSNLVLLKSAYEKFATDRVEVERYLLSGIEKGEIQIPESMPYVMFVNKSTEKQYSAVYKYDKRTKKLSFKTCNIVSTGDQVRWLEDEPKGVHVTPTRVFYIGEAKGLDHSSLKGNAEIYGEGFVKRDQEPYQMFRLYIKKGNSYEYTAYLVHPTWEEPLLGTTASHGCIRVPRLMDLQLIRIYDEWYKEQGVTDFKQFPPTKVKNPSAKMPVVVRGI
ncbi:MAG: L,D-transpeptidase [Candidatus Gracilibacteria bacterium]